MLSDKLGIFLQKYINCPTQKKGVYPTDFVIKINIIITDTLDYYLVNSRLKK